MTKRKNHSPELKDFSGVQVNWNIETHCNREHDLKRATEEQIDKLHARIGQLFVVTLKGAGHVYQHAYVDTYS
ncbi:hypothetical protein [Profundibacter sp.]